MSNTQNEKTDEEEVFEQFGLDDEDDQHRVKVLAAARVLAARKSQPKKNKRSGWGEE